MAVLRSLGISVVGTGRGKMYVSKYWRIDRVWEMTGRQSQGDSSELASKATLSKRSYSSYDIYHRFGTQLSHFLTGLLACLYLSSDNIVLVSYASVVTPQDWPC